MSVFDQAAKLGKTFEDVFDFLMSRWLKVLLLTHMALVFREIGNYLCRQFSQKKIDDRLPVTSFQKKRLGWDSSTIFEFPFRLPVLLYIRRFQKYFNQIPIFIGSTILQFL